MHDQGPVDHHSNFEKKIPVAPDCIKFEFYSNKTSDLDQLARLRVELSRQFPVAYKKKVISEFSFLLPSGVNRNIDTVHYFEICMVYCTVATYQPLTHSLPLQQLEARITVQEVHNLLYIDIDFVSVGWYYH